MLDKVDSDISTAIDKLFADYLNGERTSSNTMVRRENGRGRPAPPMPPPSDKEQSIEAHRQLIGILPFFLVFGWIVITPIFFFAASPALSGDLQIRILITVIFAMATLVADVVGYRIIAKSLESAINRLEGELQETEPEQQKAKDGDWWSE